MCLIVFAYKIHPDYALILLSNRDERYDRPTQAVYAWPGEMGIVAGQDGIHGGTWLGINKLGHCAAITRYRDPNLNKLGRQSQGLLVRHFLERKVSPQTYIEEIRKMRSEYNPYNLLLGDSNSLCYYSSLLNQIESLTPGIYGLSNAHLDTPWPKVNRAKAALCAAMAEPHNQEKLFAILQDKTPAADKDLPDTGIGIDRERALSSIFVELADYGTRSSCLLTIDYQSSAHLFEA